ncbi:MAG: hypothetical protein HY234_10400 [Acidobacteria bacterium]|nr:hypothetical protein [Acidobacteriota bacterium]
MPKQYFLKQSNAAYGKQVQGLTRRAQAALMWFRSDRRELFRAVGRRWHKSGDSSGPCKPVRVNIVHT